MLLPLIVLLPFLGSVCAALLPANARNAEAWLAGGVAAICTVLVASLYPAVTDGGVMRTVIPWLPQAGLNVYFRIDGFAWLFAMLVAFMGVLVVFYARYYMSASDPVPRFFSFLLAFMGAMLGVVLSGNLLQLVVFWELTSLTSFMLIGYWYHLPNARRGARMALIVTMAGGFCLLLAAVMIGTIAGGYDLEHVLAAGDAIRAHAWYVPNARRGARMALIVTMTGGFCLLLAAVMIGTIAGGYDLEHVLAAGDAIRSHAWYVPILALVGAAVLTKSAQFPFHFWLPQAMTAPTPVSAYLHSATMVKAGVFLLARLWPALHGTPIWFWLFAAAGGSTLLIGAFSALFQRDMKGILAYSTISHLGLITLLLGMDTELALVAAVFHMLNHATFKASLFMAAGIVEHETGTRDVSRLSGLRRAMPITAIVATIAAGAMAGVPLLNGFLSKEMFFEESIVAGSASGLRFTLPTVAILWGVFSVAYSARFIHQVFFGPVATGLPRPPHEPTRGMLVPSAALVVACLLVGVLPAATLGPYLMTAAVSLLGGRVPEYELAVWHGLTVPLTMSLIALAGGLALYLALLARGHAMVNTPLLSRLDARRAFDVLNVVIVRGADKVAHAIFSSRLQVQLLLVVASAWVAGMFALRANGWQRGDSPLTPLDPLFLLLWIAGAACALGAAQQAKFHRLAALIMLGGTGLVTCLTFAWFSAPDLALTQISVEIVTVVLLLLGLRWLPRRKAFDDPRRRTLRARVRRVRDLAVAAGVGAGLAALAFAMLTRPSVLGLAPFFVGNALEEAGGRNVVNVILVDFRGFDTLGETTVVAIVALIVYALLRRFRPAAESIDLPEAQREEAAREAAFGDPQELLPRGHMRIPAVLGRLLLPFGALVSLYFLLRGHNAPGGGFVGGLVMATAFIVQYMVGGTIWVESRLRIHPQLWVGLGLVLALAAGVAAWASSQPFLSTLTLDLRVPLMGAVHLSTVLVFDFGVYMLVIGATVLMLVALAHQALRSPRKSTALNRVVRRISAAEGD